MVQDWQYPTNEVVGIPCLTSHALLGSSVRLSEDRLTNARLSERFSVPTEEKYGSYTAAKRIHAGFDQRF